MNGPWFDLVPKCPLQLCVWTWIDSKRVLFNMPVMTLAALREDVTQDAVHHRIDDSSQDG